VQCVTFFPSFRRHKQLRYLGQESSVANKVSCRKGSQQERRERQATHDRSSNTEKALMRQSRVPFRCARTAGRAALAGRTLTLVLSIKNSVIFTLEMEWPLLTASDVTYCQLFIQYLPRLQAIREASTKQRSMFLLQSHKCYDLFCQASLPLYSSLFDYPLAPQSARLDNVDYLFAFIAFGKSCFSILLKILHWPYM
jgi:hypothetical protein